MELKVQLKPFENSSNRPAEVCQSFLRSNQDSFELVFKLVEIMLVIRLSTAECECGLSKMNNVQKCLNQESLHILMNLVTIGPKLDEFNPDSLISHWLNSYLGGRHIHGQAAKTS